MMYTHRHTINQRLGFELREGVMQDEFGVTYYVSPDVVWNWKPL